MPQPQRSSRNKKIEPLNWEVAAQSPALKGMTSFLDIPAQDIRSGRYIGALAIHSSPAADTAPEDVIDPGDETHPANATVTVGGPASQPNIRTMPSPTFTQVSNAAAPVDGSLQTTERSVLPQVVDGTPAGKAQPAKIALQANVMYSGPNKGPKHFLSPGDETYPAVESGIGWPHAVTPGRGRSKVRRCVLAQDGHSLGEEAIYQVMWRSGRPESADPNASRTIRIGAADIGFKVNMAKKNVRQNVSRLYDKLALEIMEDFETMSSQPRLYRIFSYKQILERRRAVGMEFVLRNKGVVFCTPDGEELVKSPAYVCHPGDETSIRPAPPKKRRAPLPPSVAPAIRSVATSPTNIEASDVSEVRMISEALNRYWPVDQAAAEQLLRSCRRTRPDARAEEIVFFVGEKLELARTNRNITNPTGLVLATVPQSFAGAAFEYFRERMERQAALAQEERARREREREELRLWLVDEREKNESIVNDSGLPQQDRDAAEKKLRQYATWNT